MRRLINLNQSGIVFVKIICLFGVMIPTALYIILLWSRTETVRALLLSLIKGSFRIGALMFVIFLVAMVVEQIQDHYFDMQYQKQRGQKRLLVNGNYECQYCGNQKVRENDKACSVCGRGFLLVRRK